MSKSTTFKESGIDITNNQSDLTITIKFSADNSVTWFSGATLYCTCNGTTKSASVSLSAGGSVTKSFTYSNINHNSDGTKSVNWNWSCATGTSALGTVSASGTKVLTTIPRASTVTASDGTIGQTANIKVVKKSSSFTTTLQYKMSGQSNWTTIASKISSSSYTWTLPISFYNLIPNAKKLTGTIRATTYNGSTNVGYKEDGFTAYANEEACKPVISNTAITDSVDLTSLTGDPNRFVRYISRPIMSWVVTKQNNAGSISSQKINGISATSPYTANAWSDAYNLVVTDSRGYSSTYSYSMDVIPYVIPTATYNLNRQSPTSSNIILNLNGYYYNGYFDEENTILNTITVEYRYKKTSDISWTTDNITITPDENGNFSIVNLNLGAICDYRYSWNFEIIFKDRIYTGETESTTKKVSTIINKGIPNHNWYEDSEGNNYFNINGTLLINDEPASTGGATSYNDLSNKPSINNVTLSGNKLASDLGLQNAIPGKSLSTNDFTTTYKNNVDNNTSARHTHANKSVLDSISSSDITSWNNKSEFSGSYTDLTDKPTIPDELSDLSDDSTHRLVTDTEKSTWNAKSDFSGSYTDLSNKPSIPSKTSDLTNDSGYTTFSGSYNDLTDKPTIPTVPTALSSFTDDLGSSPTHTHSQYLTSHQDISGKVDKETGKGLSSNDFTTTYKNNIDSNTSARHTHSNKSVLDDISSSDVSNWDSKQETLVSGTNLKTINNQSLLGSGNITISGGGTATDVQVNGTSITNNGVANLLTNTAYNSNNKIATMSDIPTATSDLTNDSGFITDSKVVIVEYGSNVYYSDLKNYINNGYDVICKYDYDGLGTYMYYPLTEVFESITPYYCGFSGFATNGGSNLRLKLTKNMTNDVESYGTWSFEYRNIDEDIRINHVSIVSNNIADIRTNGTYNSSTNKIATMSDVPLKTIMQAVKTSDTTNYSTSYNYFSPFNGDGDASTNISIGSGLTFGKKLVTYGDRTNNSVYGVTIGAGISLMLLRWKKADKSLLRKEFHNFCISTMLV